VFSGYFDGIWEHYISMPDVEIEKIVVVKKAYTNDN